MRFLLSLALASACTSFVKVDDAGPSDSGLGDARLQDSGAGDALNEDAGDGSTDLDAGDAGIDVLDAGPPPCFDLAYTGTLDPAFDRQLPGSDHTLSVPFSQLRARLTRVDTNGQPCLEQPANPDGTIRRFDDGSFIPVDGASFTFDGVTITIQIADPAYNDVFEVGTQRESRFGAALSAEGNQVAVGAPADSRAQVGISAAPVPPDSPEGLPSTGAVHIFDVVEDVGFDRVAFIKSNEQPFESAFFGEHVHLRDDYLAVSAPGYNTGDTEYGRIHVYHRSDRWLGEGVIERPSSFGRMRHARTQGGFVFVALPRVDLGMSFGGRVRIYERNMVGIWVSDAEIDRGGVVSDNQFGRSIEIAGDVMLVQEGVVPNAFLYLYRRVAGSWEQRAMLSLRDSEALFATDGLFAVVTDTSTHTTLYSLEGDSFDSIGAVLIQLTEARSIAIRDARIAVGLPNENAVGPGRVATVHLAWNGEFLTLARTIIDNPADGAQFGGAVAFTESAGLVVGAPLQSSSGPFGHGAVFLYE